MDVVENGAHDRAPRRGLVAGAAAVLLVAGLAVAARDDTPRTGPRAAASPSATTEPSPLGWTTYPDESPAPVAEPTPPVDVMEDVPPPTEWPLPRLRQRTRLYLAGTGYGLEVTPVDTGASRTTIVGDHGPGIVEVAGRLDGGWLAFVGEDCAFADSCRLRPLYVVHGSRATRIGEGDDAFPDPDGRTVWVTGRTAATMDSPRYAVVRWLERRTATGSRIGPRTILRKAEDVVGVTPAGPVVGPLSEHGYGAALVAADTRRRRVVVEPDHASVIAVNGYAVAWAGILCGSDSEGEIKICRVATTDVRTMHSSPSVDVRLSAQRGKLDPTGRYLALPLGDFGESGAVVDLRTGRIAPLRGLRFHGPDSMAWSPDGKWLVLTHGLLKENGMHRATQVAVWRPGWERPEIATTYEGKPGEFVVTYAP